MTSLRQWAHGLNVMALFRQGVPGLLWRERRCSACSSVFSPVRDEPNGRTSVLKGPVPGGKISAGSPCQEPDRKTGQEQSQETEQYFCPECRLHLHMRKQGFCPLCGELAAWEAQPPVPCGRCLSKSPPWQEAIFWGAHEGLLRELLLRLKFQKELPLAHALGSMLAMHPRLRHLEVDMLMPIPLHKAGLSQRGFNQSLELARPIARHLRLPLNAASLLKTRATAPQHNLPRKDRQVNVRQAFAVREAAVRNKRILLVDDTMTTGATMHAAASVLLGAGAVSVHVAVASRTAAVF